MGYKITIKRADSTTRELILDDTGQMQTTGMELSKASVRDMMDFIERATKLMVDENWKSIEIEVE